MQLRHDIQIQSILKSIADVVLPAIDPGNKLAQEQMRLCMGLLDLMARQLPLQFRFDCDELTRLLALAQRLRALSTPEQVQPGTRATLARDIDRASDVVARARAEPDEVLTAVRALRAVTSTLVREACQHGDAASTQAIERAVMDSSQQQLLRDRAWLIAQHWEPDPQSLPDIASLLSPVHSIK